MIAPIRLDRCLAAFYSTYRLTNSQLDTVLAAIADPTRRAIIDQLSRGPARVTDVAAPFAMSFNAVSKHVKVLERARLVRRTRQGREHTLELAAEPLEEVVRWASHYQRYWTERLDRLESFFSQRKSS